MKVAQSERNLQGNIVWLANRYRVMFAQQKLFHILMKLSHFCRTLL